MNRQQRWRYTFWTTSLLAIVLALSLAPYFTSSTELVRLRNALLFEPVAADAAWTPASPPAGYLLERAPPSVEFRQIVERNRLDAPDDDWEAALRIGRHLLQNANASGDSGPIQRDLSDTYHRIVEQGEGYCGDYVDVFTALATTAGLFARAWAFSFDGFGGHGHIFNEVWDRQTGSWRMIDVFNNYYVVDENDRPVSALAFRGALLRGDEIRWRAVADAARPGFKYPEKAVGYYRRGVLEWYLWWGNNAFEYDQNSLVAFAGDWATPAGQLAAIAAGIHPPIRAISEPANEDRRRSLLRLKYHVVLALILMPLLAIAILTSAWRLHRTKKEVRRSGSVR